MEPVGRNERFKANLTDIVPMPHDLEAAEEIDGFALGCRRNQRDHTLSCWLRDHLGRELRINQDDVCADCPNLCEAGADQGIVPAKHVSTNYGIRSELPQNEIRLFRK